MPKFKLQNPNPHHIQQTPRHPLSCRQDYRSDILGDYDTTGMWEWKIWFTTLVRMANSVYQPSSIDSVHFLLTFPLWNFLLQTVKKKRTASSDHSFGALKGLFVTTLHSLKHDYFQSLMNLKRIADFSNHVPRPAKISANTKDSLTQNSSQNVRWESHTYIFLHWKFNNTFECPLSATRYHWRGKSLLQGSN